MSNFSGRLQGPILLLTPPVPFGSLTSALSAYLFPRRFAQQKTSRQGARGPRGTTLVPRRKSVGALVGARPSAEGDALGCCIGALPAHPTGLPAFGARLPGPFGSCADAGLSPFPGSLESRSERTRPVRSLYENVIGSLARTPGYVNDNRKQVVGQLDRRHSGEKPAPYPIRGRNPSEHLPHACLWTPAKAGVTGRVPFPTTAN